MEPFSEHNNCGGYDDLIYNEDTKEYEEIEGAVHNVMNELGIHKFTQKTQYVYDNPGTSVSLLIIAYVNELDKVRVVTYEIIDC